MKYLALIAAVLILSGCAVFQKPDTPTRRFAVCMKQTLGTFADFKPTDARMKAAEICQTVAQATAPAPTT